MAKLYSLGKQIGFQLLPPGIAVAAESSFEGNRNNKLAHELSQENNSQSFLP